MPITGNGKGLTHPDHNGRGGGGERSLAWGNVVCLRGSHSKEVGDVGRREIVHFIVQDHSCLCDQLGAKEGVDCAGRKERGRIEKRRGERERKMEERRIEESKK